MTTISRFSTTLLLVAALAACSPEAPKFRSTDITGADFGKALALTGHDGKPRVLEDFRGKLVVLFFGFTHCPDICPTTLADTAAALKELGPDAARVQVLFVTVDPERDTQIVLSQYVPSFHPSFLGLYGDAQETARAAKAFKIYYQKRPVEGRGYSVDHSAGTFVLEWLQFRLLVRSHAVEAYIALVAAGFMILGIWLGAKFRRVPVAPFAPNTRAQETLGISGREIEVLELLAAGQSNKEIARRLEVSPNTVKTHVTRLFAKLEARRRTEAILRARELGMLP